MTSKLMLTVSDSAPETTMTRVFDAPKALVFKAHVDAGLIARWWGGPWQLTTVVEQMDVRPGGKWRFVERDPDGQEHAYHGEYREIVSNEKLVYTFEYEGMPGHVIIDTLIFTEQDGQTTLANHSTYQSTADRDGMIQSGMAVGAAAAMDRLEALLATL